MLQGIAHLSGDILIEGASASDIHRLHASANAQRGDCVAYGKMDEAEFKIASPFRNNGEFILLPLSIQSWAQVWTAPGQKQPVESLEQPPTSRRVGNQWQNHRDATQFFYGTNIAGTEKICRLFATPFFTIAGIEVGGDSDDGFHTSEWVPKEAV